MSANAEPLCPHGHSVPTGARFCPTCAAPITDPLDVPANSWPTSEPVADGTSKNPPALAEHDAEWGARSAGDMREMDTLGFEAGSVAMTPDAGPAAGDGVSDANRTGKSPRRRKGIALLATGIVLLLSAGAFAAWWFGFRETDQDRYLAALRKTEFAQHYATEEVALATGNAVCADLAAGRTNEGYDYQEPAVRYLCPEYRSTFKVIPTPEQQAADYTQSLRQAGLGGKFSSDAAAVAHAESVCRSLDEGGEQQGPEEDAVAVTVYCSKYASGFKTLRPIKVTGTFTLIDSDPSIYYQSISGSNSYCYGSSGYGDISGGTEVVVKNGAGDVLTTTALGSGKGYPPSLCKFKFSFTVMDGEKGGYVVAVGRRGETHYTAAELKLPDAVTLTMG